MTENDRKNLYDAIIIGGGPAGLTAAIYLARAYYRVLVVEKEKFGGQITITSEVVNYPGVARTSGEELTDEMKKQAQSFGAEFLLAEVSSIDMAGEFKEVHTSRGVMRSFGVVLATGAMPRMIGFEGELDFRGHGVAYCATCDGEFFSGKDVFVVGGGFAAAEESVFLTKYANHVTILIREDDFTCAKTVADHARNHEKITILTNTEVVRVEGDSLLRSITYRNNKTGEETVFRAKEGDTFGVFVFAGYEPATKLVKGIADLDERGYIITDRTQKTSAEGLYAAGDVCIKPLRQVVTAVGDGAMAATELEKYIAGMQKKTGLHPQRPVRESGAGKQIEPRKEKPASEGASGGLFTEDMLAQLNTVFDRMEGKLLLRLYLDERPVSAELREYMQALVNLTDKLELEIASGGEDLPCVRVCREDKSETGLAFHGVPGGHEFTSFVLGLYNAAGPGQSLDEEVQKRIEAIDQDIEIKIMVSLTCTVCPDLVIAAQRIAAASERVRTDIYDINHFGEFRDQYQIMSVPCMVINENKPVFGKKDIRQILDLFSQLSQK